MESMPSFANVFLWIAMFFAISYAVIYMAVITHGIMQDKDKKASSKFRDKFKFSFRRKIKKDDVEPLDVKGIKTEPNQWKSDYRPSKPKLHPTTHR